MTTTQIKRTVATLSIVAASLIGYYRWITPTGNNGLYGKVGSWIQTPAGRLAEAKKVTGKGFNDVAYYGISDYLVTHPECVADFNLQLRRLGVKDISLIYSKAGTVVNDLDYFQRKQTNDSCKFSSTASEIEPYNTGDYAGFYSTIKQVGEYDHSHGLFSWYYYGWPKKTEVDSMVKYGDGVWLHSYIQMDKYSNVGDALFGYQSTRLSSFALAASKIQKKFHHRVLTSNENSDPAKTQFGYKWYLTHSQKEAISSFQNTYALRASSIVKNWIIQDGGQLFYEKYLP